MVISLRHGDEVTSVAFSPDGTLLASATMNRRFISGVSPADQGDEQWITLYTLMQRAFRMFDVLALIAMLVDFMGITNTLTMNVMKRTQEIGMLRAVVMTRGQVVCMVLSEAALMGLIGGVMGLVFGVVFSRLFLSAMTSMSGTA